MRTNQQEVIERLDFYKTSSTAWRWIKERENEKQFGTWARVVAQHFEKEMLPRLKGSEALVEFFQAQFLWGQQTHYRSGITNDRVYRVQGGTFGTGYFCLTNANIYIVSFAELTKKYPLKETSLIATFFLSLLGERDETKPLQKDGFWTIPLRAIQDAKIVGSNDAVEHIILNTNATSWSLFVVDDLPFTLEAINMARFDQLGGSLTKVSADTTSTAIYAARLQGLKELFEAGLITQNEYNVKKQELLSQL